ncbi:N,N-dimethylformamidase beta subunit family domain-containing protein [Methylorubrum zatmanii]|uniref:N,N-dimethylformamidase beta subunit family domain-containing protein n=1 Tax=Methylorubrum zatmanii TaxID=29429 RepID=A0ABW1WTZ2_9HYPH|nr:N,N-dimethylformamidase beta subunit family domain-containing protein [Methylorubrum zatmanii]MBD8906688.1 N,N-dimethylformamidase [Methylorubrum zatmanii]
MAELKIFGYADKISVKPGDALSFYVHADGASEADAQLVRLIHGDAHPDGPGYQEEELQSPLNGSWPVRKQFTQVGSFCTVADLDHRLALDGSFTLCTFVYANRVGDGLRQCLLGRWDAFGNRGYGLWLNPLGLLEFGYGDGREVDYIDAEVPLLKQHWYFVAASFDAKTGAATLYQESAANRYNSLLSKVAGVDYRSHVRETLRFRPLNPPEVPFLLAGAEDFHEVRGRFVTQCMNGKLDRPAVFDRVLSRAELDELRQTGLPPSEGIVAFWDTSHGYTAEGIGDHVHDIGPHGLHATGYNRPVRAQTGFNWNGRSHMFQVAPHEFGGIEFHDDAIIDCNWELTKTWAVPADLRSGAYAFRLRLGDGKGLREEYIVFFVRPAVPRAPIAFLVPTASYLAYANEHLSFDAEIMQPLAGQSPILSEIDIELYQTKSFGLSLYDHHSDGVGCCYSSYRRPILNMRPKVRMSSMGVTWQFPADLSILAWLEHAGYDFEILTDEDLHLEGVDALKPYRVVLSGSHPEYVSEKMLDATEDYIAGGGRYIYMGGNGYYWNIGLRDDEPWCVEVRKLNSGMRAWQARPGEYHMASNGQKSGIWKDLGRPPQKLMGVGFISEGFDSSRPFRRMPDSWHRRASWIFEGIEGEIIGDFGLAHAAAGGLEIDRYDLTLGTPPHALIVASSGGHSDNYVTVTEEVLYPYPGLSGSHDYRIRADMVFFTAPNGGAVFSASSIAFGQSLPFKNFDNNVAKLLGNVLTAFQSPKAVPGWAWTLDEKQFR